MKYLAKPCGSEAYPAPLQAKARVNEMTDWFNTNFYRTFGYELVYPQILDPCKLSDANAWRLLVEAGKSQAERFLAILNDHILGASNPWLRGKEISVADYFASGIVSLGETIGCSFSPSPNISTC